MTHPLLAIYCESTLAEQQQRAQQLHQELDLPLLATPSPQFLYLLVLTDHRIELRLTNSKTQPVYVDFLSAAAQYRRLKSNRKNELIAKAVGIKGKEKPSVLDATAGLGQDGFILANLGCPVHCLERSPVIAALLQDGIDRFLKSASTKISLSLTAVDAILYLQQLDEAEFPDVIYLDPMFPTRQKSALVKKEMRVLRDIVGYDQDTALLLAQALQVAKKRVVVKRPRLAPAVIGKSPDLVLEGSSCRFDVYFCFSHNFKES